MVTFAKRARRSGSYGVDAPYLLPIPLALFVIHLIQGAISGTAWPFVAAGLLAACVGCGLHTSLRGKFAVWSDLLDALALRGDERVLDLGCGRGAVLLAAADHLSTGRSIGVDLWRKADQSGNAALATWRNAIAEGVAERVALCTGDMVALPFQDGSFDLVLSSLAVHNIKGHAGRVRAIDEAVRVLRPGGRLVIADLFATRLYRRRLEQLGMMNVARRGWAGGCGGQAPGCPPTWSPQRNPPAGDPLTQGRAASA